MRLSALLLAATAAMSLAACQRGSGDGEASERAVEQAGGSEPTMQRTPDGATTGAAGATTSATDPNPAGTGATTGATPGDTTGAMGSTSPEAKPPVTAAPEPK